MIKVKNLSFQYDDQNEVIKDLSLEIPRGKWISILGHNGSGKSTFAKLLVGLLKAHQGEILIDGIKMEEKNLANIRAKIGIVFQNPDNQFVGVTVRHDIAFGLENQNIPTDEIKLRVEKYADMVGMKPFLYKEPHQLSGGQKQRVAIAGALAMHQEIIIFDEATSMLDPEGVNEVTLLIKTLNKEHGQTIITITHDLDFALLSDYAYILKEGEIIGEGKPQELLSKADLLASSQLKIPFALNLYHDIKADEKLSKNKALVDALWAYNMKT